MIRDDLPHLIIENKPQVEGYTNPSQGGGELNIPSRNRTSHGTRIKGKFEKIWQEVQKTDAERQAISLTIQDGIYLEFISELGYDLVTKGLEALRSGIRLLNIRRYKKNEKVLTKATIYLPKAKVHLFLKKINTYLDPGQDTTNIKGTHPKNYMLIDSIQDLRLAVLESFWSDHIFPLPKENQLFWCEVWLRTDESQLSGEAEFFKICKNLGIDFNKNEIIEFPEYKIVLIKADRKLLTALLSESQYISEFRLARETARFWVELENKDRVEWVKHALERLNIEKERLISVCVLDTGINNTHDLLAPVIPDANCFTINPDWGIQDKEGHGTLMCGVVSFGDLQKCLESDNPINILHSVESVKLLQKSGDENDPHLYGYLTEQGVYKPEIDFPERKRILCMAVTAKECSDGSPTSWSGSVDKLTSGMEDDNKRLFIVSAGNIVDKKAWGNYPNSNMSFGCQILEPAQAWNALTVGAFTLKDKITSPYFDGYKPLAQKGELSPFSRTSWAWNNNKWPVKPDVVFEGGNVATNGTNIESIDDLSILSTANERKQFEVINATSAATANASWFASQLQLKYPNLWPETIRGLIVHSAEWTEQLKNQFCNESNSDKVNYCNLLKTCGYGVPNLHRALFSANNGLTLIAENTIQPFQKDSSNGKTRYKTKDMHLLELPWPKDFLLNLEDTHVTLKITLSYYIEPGPGEKGWKERYRYPSHALRFALKRPDDNDEVFIKRLSAEAREEDEEFKSSPDNRWEYGTNNRNKGSIHSDIWKTTAAQLSTCDKIGIYPVIGWWRERAYLGSCNKQARYSLIVSLQTPNIETDLYTPISIALKTPISIPTEI